VLSASEGNARRGAGALSVDQDTFYIQWCGQATPVGELVAINTDDGTVKWRYPNGLVAGADGAPIYSVTVDKNGKVFFVLNDGTDYKVACVKDEGTSATLIWEQTIGASNTPASFSLGGDGTLYFACNIDGTDAVWAIKDIPPPAPEIIDMDRGSMSIKFTSNSYFKYRIESSTSAYDYVESNMTWVTEVDDLAGEAICTTWTDPSPPTSGQKFYRVFAKSADFGDQASDTVGLQLVDVYNGRNLVSSPFEPYGAGFFNTCAAQVSGSVWWTTNPWEGFQWVVSPSYGSFEDDGTDQFVRTHIPAGSGHWGGYMRIYFETPGLIGGPIDASAGAIMEFDMRVYADPGNPQTVYDIWAYCTSYDSNPDHTNLGRAFPPYFYFSDEGDPYPAWQHVKLELGGLAGDPGFTVDNIDAITIITPGCSGIVNENWIDMKDLKVTYYGDTGTSTLDKIVGEQLTGHSAVRSLSDTIEAWDTVNQKYVRAWLQTGSGWKDWDVTANPAQFGLDADVGYWFNRVLGHPDTTVMLFGRVSPTDRTIPIGIKRNLVGSCFPVGSTLDDSGLEASGFIGHGAVRSLSDTVEFWDNATASYERFWLKVGTGFQPWDVGDPMRDIAPGDAIWVNLPLRTVGFTWTYPSP
jgi:hypothetical protein